MMRPRWLQLQYSLKEDLTAALKLILIILWLTTPFWITILRTLPPKFSLQVVGATATGLDDNGASPPTPTPAPIDMSTVFNMTLRAANRRPTRRCYSNGEAAVRYAGHTVAWGRTMAFCVGAGEARDVPLVAWADGVGVGGLLPRALRERMAADWRGDGAVELEVDVKLFRGDDGSGTPAWVTCKVTAGGGGAKPPPPTFTPCATFALQNWASDISDHLLALTKSLIR